MKDNPLLWVLGAIGISVIGFLLLDQYTPTLGVIWNVENGTVWGVPYRYFLVVATILILFAGYSWLRHSREN
jgi:hypothetical protein